MNTTNSTNNIAHAPDDPGKHTHDCEKCGLTYVHYHPHKAADHKQFSYQCPNAACEWHFSKGKATLSKDAGATDSHTEQRRTTETYAQRSVRIAYAEGKIKCGNAKHFVMKSNGGQYKVPVRIPAQQLLDLMPLGADARCPCETSACKEAWSWNRPGVFETEWVQPGSFHKGFGKYEPGATPRRVMPLSFNLTKAQVAYLHEQHPGWLFVTVDTQFHDHPVAHATSQVATYNLFHALRAGKYLDLHGNPAMCDRLNDEMKDKKFISMCNVESTDDVIRKRTKWGPKELNGKVRWIESALRDLVRDNGEVLREMDGLTSIHTLYYYAPEELPGIISQTKGKLMTAMMHRFVGEKGTLNNGEQTWRRYKDGSGRSMIEQTNVLTGKKYVHADNERWFANTSWSPQRGLDVAGHLDDETALTWDANLVAAGVYVFRITSCTVREASLDTTWKEPAAEKPPVVNSDDWVRIHGHVVIDNKLSGQEKIVVPPAYQDLFRELRVKMLSAKMRDTAKYVAHAQYTAIKAKSVMGNIKDVNDVQVLYDLVYASFWVDSSLDRQFSASIGHDFRRQVLDTIIIAATSRSVLAGLAETLRSVRHRI